MSKVVAFVGETYNCFEEICYAKPTSAAFLQDAFGVDNVFVASSARNVNEKPVDASTIVDEKNFYAFPKYKSTQDFVVSCVLKRGFYRDYVSRADEVITKHSNAIFWIRTPSIGSILFGLRVIRAKRILLHHMCADASNTWKDMKYKGLNKFMAFMFSRVLRFLLRKICASEYTTNLCTGDVLESFSRKYSPGSTFQFVDLMVHQLPQASNIELLSNKIRLLFVGRVVEDKGIFDLLYALSKLGAGYVLDVVGDGPDVDRALKYTKELDIESQVVFSGQVIHEQLEQFFSVCHLVVIPSNNNYEGFPRVIMEAWSYSRPVIVSQVGGVLAFVKNDENGIVFPPGNREALIDSIVLAMKSKTYEQLCRGAAKQRSISVQSHWISVVKSTLNINNYAP